VELSKKLGIEVDEANIMSLDVVEPEERFRVPVPAALVHGHHGSRLDPDRPMEHVIGEAGERSVPLPIALVGELAFEGIDAEHERVFVDLGPAPADAAGASDSRRTMTMPTRSASARSTWIALINGLLRPARPPGFVGTVAT
jgi:hypothetical protein